MTASRLQRTRAILGLLGLLITTAILGACSGEDGASSSARPAGPAGSASASAAASRAPAPPPAPARGGCYRLTYAQALAPTSEQPAVGCDAGHTSQTFVVGRLQSEVRGHLVAVDSDAVQRSVATTCPQRLRAYLGGTPEQLDLSLLRAVWFTPSVTQSDAGATWFRCDVVAAYGDDQLADLGGSLKGALRSPRTRAAYAMCATDRPGTADFRRVLCRDPHSWRAISAVDLSGLAGDAGHFPGLAAVKAGDERDGEHVCADAARDVAADALDYQWGYEWPTRTQWRTGQDFGRCWAPDTGTSSEG